MPQFSKKANLSKDFEAIAKSRTGKAYICFCLDEEDSFEDELDHYVVVKLAIFDVIMICVSNSISNMEQQLGTNAP